MHIYNGNVKSLNSSTDKSLVRILEIAADYEVECSLLTDNIVRATLTSLVNGRSNQIKATCRQGMLYYLCIVDPMK